MVHLVGRIVHGVRGSLALVGLVVVVVAATAAVTATVLAVSGPGDSDGGTTAPGSHEWYAKVKGQSNASIEANVCSQCHSQIETEIVATETGGYHPQTSCLACHGAGGGSHAAEPALCVDCHNGPANALAAGGDAHTGMLGDLGEDGNTASWTCKACHTRVAVAVTSPDQAPLAFTMN